MTHMSENATEFKKKQQLFLTAQKHKQRANKALCSAQRAGTGKRKEEDEPPAARLNLYTDTPEEEQTGLDGGEQLQEAQGLEADCAYACADAGVNVNVGSVYIAAEVSEASAAGGTAARKVRIQATTTATTNSKAKNRRTSQSSKTAPRGGDDDDGVRDDGHAKTSSVKSRSEGTLNSMQVAVDNDEGCGDHVHGSGSSSVPVGGSQEATQMSLGLYAELAKLMNSRRHKSNSTYADIADAEEQEDF